MTESTKTNTDKQVQQKRTAPEPEKKEVERLIYVGPTLPFGLTEFAVFTGGIPKTYEKRFEATPELRDLFIPLGDFAKQKNDATTPGTAIYAAREVVASKRGAF